ncbi:hypothetical protein [Solirubrum puertoriconensis]|uniref:Uncharacterized protein n=1 Tax=Solirubrum puertoriconensis TaxID=1751427 RepID=A0A9X0L4B1_SOLP1|nr:hypothetical protein [Solirubrum puertoriconensis]KUG07420.1 hypothetical protein ASU33_13790 [Solirubrum puertoriconensis]
MITLFTDKDNLFQLPKNQVTVPLGLTCDVYLTGFNELQVQLPATVSILTNCYILSTPATAELPRLGLNGTLEVVQDNQVVYATHIQFREPESILIDNL